MKQIASLRAEMSFLTVVLSISNSEYSFPLQESGNAFSLPLGCSGSLRFKLFNTLAFGALLCLLFGILHCQAILPSSTVAPDLQPNTRRVICKMTFLEKLKLCKNERNKSYIF